MTTTMRTTMTEAAELVGVSRTTLHRRIVSGELVAVRSERDRRKRLVDLEAVRRLFAESAEEHAA